MTKRGKGYEFLENWCLENGPKWKHMKSTEMYGREDECIILLDCDRTVEYISRARNLLIIVTTPKL